MVRGVSPTLNATMRPPCRRRRSAGSEEASSTRQLDLRACGDGDASESCACLPARANGCRGEPDHESFFALWAPCCRRDKPAVTRRGQAIVLELLQALTSQQGTESKDWLFSRQDITGYHIIARKRLQQISQFSGC